MSAYPVDDGGRGSRAGLPDLPRPAGRTVAVFVAGLLLGWIVLGWYVFPVKWVDTTPADLRDDARRTYVQMVAESYGRTNRLDVARERLAWLTPERQAADLAAVAADPVDPGAAQSAQALGQAMGYNLAAAAAAVTAAAGAESAAAGDAAAAPAAGSLTDAARTLVWLALVAALAALATLAVVWWLMQRRARAAGGLEGAALTPEEWQWETSPAGEPAAEIPAGAWPAATLEPGGHAPAGVAQATADTAPMRVVQTTTDPAATPAARRRVGTPAPVWRPARVTLGQTIRAEYLADETPSIQSWLVYNQRGGLEGGAGLLVRPVGEVNTLDLWFSDRDDVDQTTKTPKVTLAARAACNDPVLHAWLADRRVVPAVPGETVTLETLDLVLDVTVEAVDPPPHADDASLTAVTLALTPRRAEPRAAGGARPALAAAPAADDDAEGAHERRPLPFRRD